MTGVDYLPALVSENEENIKKYSNLNELKSVTQGWLYDNCKRAVYIKLRSHNSSKEVIINE